MNKLMNLMATLGVAVVLLTSCEKAPQAEIDAAAAAVADAKAAEADVYAADDFTALQNALTAVNADVEAENSKFFKNYDAVKTKLADVTAQAATVKQAAEENKIAMKAEVEKAIADLNGLIEAGKNLAENAPKGKEGASAVAAIQEELNALQAASAEAAEQLAQGAIVATRDKVAAATEKATAINAELQSVIEKYATAKKK